MQVKRIKERVVERLRADRQRGMTLIEVLIAVGMLTVGMTGLMASLLGAMSSASYSRAQSIALHDAKGLLEALLLLPATGTPATAETLLAVATNVNGGAQNPSAVITLPIGAQERLPSQAFTVNVLTPSPGGPAPYIGNQVLAVPQVAAALPTATLEEYEIVVTVNWLQGQRAVSMQVRTVRNMLP